MELKIPRKNRGLEGKMWCIMVLMSTSFESDHALK